ncbi:DUF2784 domain-containing protein [Ferrimonas sediminicola]|uniref:DUF2784 domain-containing protein n=1 Tax=Ferrimonas sediminicola TaxID=2569538 RepID=A0A4U1BFM1_9GAMM|nr:DUF2784 domain-containing protein [Ferrimonas sediminicola]TKB49917.1 DUF2784 domain-containing protein [Ferrimonas sediminicola]
MLYHLAAEAVLVTHLLFILFALFGALLGLWQRWLLWLHLPAAVWAIVVGYMGWICPLTPLENHLRNAAGEQGLDNGFIEHYLLPIIYPQGADLDLQMLFGSVALTANLLLYALVLYRLYRAKVSAPHQ